MKNTLGGACNGLQAVPTVSASRTFTLAAYPHSSGLELSLKVSVNTLR